MTANAQCIFEIDRPYTREQVLQLLGIDPIPSGGPWFTGYARHGDEWFIFCHVGSAGRTGHEYGNEFHGDLLVWRGKTGSHKDQRSIRHMTESADAVHIFYRRSDRGPFTYAGAGTLAKIYDTKPVTVVWSLGAVGGTAPSQSGQELPANRAYTEGAVRTVQVNAFERNPEARAACLRHYGTACLICGFDFESLYGAIGGGFIHVHHVVPLSTIDSTYNVDPIHDLIPVCPNCHAMLHRKSPPYTAEELRKIIAKH